MTPHTDGMYVYYIILKNKMFSDLAENLTKISSNYSKIFFLYTMFIIFKYFWQRTEKNYFCKKALKI